MSVTRVAIRGRRCHLLSDVGLFIHPGGSQLDASLRPGRVERACRRSGYCRIVRFRSDPGSIRGSIAPVVTPFTADGELDVDSLRGLVRWQLASGSHGISIGGSTGEPSAQTVAERIAAMGVVAAEVADTVPFMPGTGSAKLDETLELTQAAIDLGADAALVITPYYSRPTQQGLYEWYGAVARTFPDMPIVLYNVPIRTAVDVAPETVARLRRDFANIVGVKETTKDFEHFSRVFHLCGRDTLMWSGIELLCLPLLALGGIGFVSAVANIAPGAVASMYEHWVAGRTEEALDIHYALHPLVDLLFVETNPAPIKNVLWRSGQISSDHVRPPLVSPTPSGLAKIDQLLVEGASMLEGRLAKLAAGLM
jgi:4-hydroxy-tetrahydrodipicolinate synthase